MGLDMYLSRKTFVGNQYKENEEDQVGIVLPSKKDAFNKGISLIKKSRISEIEERVGYWRKANAIHKWMVDNVQDGEDDCKEYAVTMENLKDLLKTVNTILTKKTLGAKKSAAMKLLPPQSGFFFGSTGIDEYYFEDLLQTREIIENIISEDPECLGSYYYQASW